MRNIWVHTETFNHRFWYVVKSEHSVRHSWDLFWSSRADYCGLSEEKQTLDSSFSPFTLRRTIEVSCFVVEISFVMSSMDVGIQDQAGKQGFVGKHDISAGMGGFICGSYSRWRAAWSIAYPWVWICWKNEEEKKICHQRHIRYEDDLHLTVMWPLCLHNALCFVCLCPFLPLSV